MAGTYLFAAFERYRRDGGIGIVSEGSVCEQCWSNGQCLTCHEYYGDKNLTEHGLCGDCRLTASDDDPEIEALELDIARVVKQKEEMIKLKPEHAKSYAKQAEKTIEELKDKLHKLVAHWADVHC